MYGFKEPGKAKFFYGMYFCTWMDGEVEGETSMFLNLGLYNKPFSFGCEGSEV